MKDKESGKPKTEDTYENQKKIIEFVEKYRNISIRKISKELELNKSFVQKVLNTSGYNTFKISNIPMLKYEHKVQRINFAEWLLKIKKQTTDVIWRSDE